MGGVAGAAVTQADLVARQFGVCTAEGIVSLVQPLHTVWVA